MNKFFRQQESDTQQPGGLQIATRVMKWLAALIQLTEEEQKDAGIYYSDDQYTKEYRFSQNHSYHNSRPIGG